MRDLLVFALFATLLPTCFLKPWFGLMAFSWLAYNRTQDLTWGFARALPISNTIAIAMIAGWLVWEYRPLWFRDARLKAMVLLVVVVTVSMVANTIRWEAVGNRWTELLKIVFVALLTAALLVNRSRLRQFMLVVAFALGFYGIKNAIWFLLGGETIVGPGGMLKDNNDFALAMVMNLPLLWYLSYDTADLRFGRALKWFLRFAFFMTILTVMSTGSRGGFLAMAVTLGWMAWKTRFKVPAMVGVLVLGVLGALLAPPEYIERIRSIKDASDQSSLGRIVSWKVAGNMIEANPVLGIGYNNFVWEYQRYTKGIALPPDVKEVPSRVAHNSYLQIWAESGTIAFGLFMFMVLSTVWRMNRLGHRVRGGEDDWIRPYALAIEVTLMGYLTGATFLNRAHFDLLYQFVAAASTFGIVIVAERERRARAARRRRGPALEHETSVGHRDPFVRLPAAS